MTNEEQIEYGYDESAALKADEAASRLEHATAYVGSFKKASDLVAKSGARGIEFEFYVPGAGEQTFALYTRNAEGAPIFGANFVNAIQFMFGIKGFRGKPGKVERFEENGEGKRARVEVDGIVFPDLCDRPIGLVFQKEMYSSDDGKDRERLSLVGVFQPETRLMMSEIKERKTVPAKLEKLLKTLKVKDTRKCISEAAQPSMGAAIEGDY